ncbi:HD domain-containing protein, partial [Streptomyces sp. NPDC005921]
MPDEAQPLTAAKPEPASAPAAKPAPNVSQTKNDTRGPVEHAQSAPAEKSAETSRPKPAPPERPAARPNTGQPARSGSSNRVRARLARLGVQRANPYNPVLEPLLRIVRSNDPKIENATLRQIERAYQVAERWHRGQKRKSGDPYITHPLAVTTILAELGMDPATLMAGLLHDTVEDTEYGLEDLRRDFGDVVTLLVDGVTKLDKVKFGEAAQAETVRKMVVAMAKDPRVLVIKLADRLHNMRTMRYLKREKQEKKARETLKEYPNVPIGYSGH